jgi:hypothetical protein
METTEDLYSSFSIGRSLADPPLVQHFAMTTAGFVIPTITGLLSTICSILILYAIYKSPLQLSTTYHRIMTMMSIFDILGSVCIALTTLPMPSDDSVRYAGPMLGNKHTCQIQGYISTFGLAGGSSLYMCLSWYFVFRMTFMMNLDTISKRIEPFFYLYSLGLALFLSSYNLSKDLLNTIPSDQFCSIGVNHSNCTYSIEEDYFMCDLLYTEFYKALDIAMYLIGSNLCMIVIAMIIIIWTITKKSKIIKHLRKDMRQRENEDDKLDAIFEFRYARVLVFQALMYIFAYLITWVFMVIPMAVVMDRKSYDVIQLFKSIFFPMQGFWNLIIFVYDKVYLLHQDDKYQGYWQRVKIVLFHPAKVLDIVLPDSLVIKNKDSSQEEVPIANNNDNNEGLQDVSQSFGSGSLESDIEQPVQFGFRRIGRMKITRKDLREVSASIESPSVFVNDSICSIRS